jgi:2-hydroxychromene-2-carboxylate isomerase
MHPAAVLKAVQLRSVGDALAAATQEAAARGVTTVPAIWTAGAVHYGDAGLDAAAAAL